MTFARLGRLRWALHTDAEFRAIGWFRGKFLYHYYRGRLRDHGRSRDVPLVARVHVRHQVSGRPAAITMRIGPAGGDWLVVRGVWVHQDYFHPSLTSCRTILDVGANIGVAAVWFHAIAPDARIACVEPDPRNQPLLRRNLADNGVNATVFECAASPMAGEMRLGFGLDTGWSSLEGAGLHHHVEHVPVRTRRIPHILDELGWTRVDLIKLDVEGLERDLFADAADWLPRTGRIVFELHENTSAAEIGRLLSPHGWTLERLGREVEATFLAAPDARLSVAKAPTSPDPAAGRPVWTPAARAAASGPRT